MGYILLGFGIIFIISFLSYVGTTSFSHKRKKEDMNEDHAHRDFRDIEEKNKHQSLRNRLK